MKENNTISKGLSWAFTLNLLFAIIELIGGFLTNSTAIITDAFHDFMDAAAIGAALYMDKYSKKSASENFSFGYKRFSLLSGILLSSALLIGASFMVYHAITSFQIIKPVNSTGMFLLALLGIAINGFAFFKIKNEGSDESHHHAHGHSHTHAHASHTKNANSKAVMLHLLEDVLGWVAVLVGSAIMYFTHWYWIDALLTLLIALFIAYNAVTNLYSTFKILLQATPDGINLAALKANISNIIGVEETLDVKIWSIDGNTHVANVRVVIADLNTYENVQSQIRSKLENLKISEVYVQIDLEKN